MQVITVEYEEAVKQFETIDTCYLCKLPCDCAPPGSNRCVRMRSSDFKPWVNTILDRQHEKTGKPWGDFDQRTRQGKHLMLFIGRRYPHLHREAGHPYCPNCMYREGCVGVCNALEIDQAVMARIEFKKDHCDGCDADDCPRHDEDVDSCFMDLYGEADIEV